MTSKQKQKQRKISLSQSLQSIEKKVNNFKIYLLKTKNSYNMMCQHCSKLFANINVFGPCHSLEVGM